jgi:hypothetical protein
LVASFEVTKKQTNNQLILMYKVLLQRTTKDNLGRTTIYAPEKRNGKYVECKECESFRNTTNGKTEILRVAKLSCMEVGRCKTKMIS